MWLKEGDKNTRLFHTQASLGKKNSSIHRLRVNGFDCDGTVQIGYHAANFYKVLFTEDKCWSPLLNLNMQKVLNTEEAGSLCCAFQNLRFYVLSKGGTLTKHWA